MTAPLTRSQRAEIQALAEKAGMPPWSSRHLFRRAEDADFVDAARIAIPAYEAALVAAEAELVHERDHSKMLSESNSALHVEKRAVEDFCAKLRGEVEQLKKMVTMRGALETLRDEAHRVVVARSERDALAAKLAAVTAAFEALKDSRR